MPQTGFLSVNNISSFIPETYESNIYRACAIRSLSNLRGNKIQTVPILNNKATKLKIRKIRPSPHKRSIYFYSRTTALKKLCNILFTGKRIG